MNVLIGLVIAIFLGALIGLQREYTQQKEGLKKFAGFRTFILITLLGAILGYLSQSILSWFVLAGFLGVLLMSIVSSVFDRLKFGIPSSTTEISAVLSYIVGAMCTTGYTEVAVVLAVLITAFLTFKENLHEFAHNIEKKELIAVIKFALISFVVLPFLPNKNYSPMDIPGLYSVFSSFGISDNILLKLDVFNFYNIWLMVVLIAGIGFLGYILVRFIGSKKGYGLAGFVGGLVSSTAVAFSMAAESKKHKKITSPFVLAIVTALGVMFLRIIFVIAVVNPILLGTLILPLVAMALMSFGIAFFFSKKKEKMKKIDLKLKQPFAFMPALKFGLFFALILLISRIAQISFGDLGLYFTSLFSGLADVDVIALTMSGLSKTGSIGNLIASTCILIAIAANTVVKIIVAYLLGTKKLGNTLLWIFSLIFLVGFGVLFLL